MDDLPNAADRKAIRRQAKAARLADIQRGDVVRSIMSTTQGRAWLWDVLSSTAMFHTTFNGDALHSAFAEGRRAVGLSILADILRSCPDQYIQAMREANERHDSNNRSPDLDDPAAPAERRPSAQPDGGDSGTGADSSAGSSEDDPGSEADYTSPGRDIYVETGPRSKD